MLPGFKSFPSFLHSVRFWLWWTLPALLLTPSPTGAQTLAIANDIQTMSSLSATAATVSGRAELRLTGSGDVLPGSTVNLTSPDSWLIFTRIAPSAVISTFLSRVLVSSVPAVADANVRVVQYGMGAVVIPQAPDFQPLEAFDGRYFRGTSWKLNAHAHYDTAALGAAAGRISSFKLKRGYLATFAASDNGASSSRCYVAQDGDIELTRLPASLDNRVRYVRVFPWRWVSKKGIAGNIASAVHAHWWYNWNLDQNSTSDREYVAIRQSRYWPGLDQNWKARGVNHVLGYNEPDNSVEANLSVGDAISSWPDVLWPGLRAGSPAPTDGGLNWLYSFVDQADADGLRVDYIAVHYYRSYWNNNDPGAIANQFYNFLKGIYDRTRRPIWITEWNNGANWTGDPDPTESQQADAVEAIITMLDNTPFVERYALYNWVEDSRRLVWDDGWPRAAGVIYRDKESPIGHRQELEDSDIGRTARYRFDGSLTDDGGNGQDALRVGTPSFVSGRHGQAVQFDGVNDYLQLPESVGNSTDFTFAAWVYWNGGANWQRIFDLGDDTQHYLFLTTKAGSGGGTRFAITTGGGNGEQRLDAATFPTNVWTHVAVTLKGDTGKLFINGAPSATNGSMSLNPDGIGVKFNYLGHSRYAADPNFNGRLDDVRFLTSALTDAQIASLASSAPPAFSAASVAAPNAIVYQPYSATLTTLASGGSGGLTFAKMDGPSWLKISSSGTLSGTPGSADAGVNRFVVRVTDAVGGAELAELTVDVEALAAVPVTVASSISSGANDAEESAAGAVTLDSTDLEMTHDPALAGLQTVALRFSLQVPPGAFIQDARIQFTPDEDQDEATSLTISVEAADQAAAFSTATGNLTGRTRHPVTIPWDPAAWVAGAAGPAHQTPNLAGLVQSTVLRSGWQLGNAMVFIFSGTGQRTAEAFEKSGGTPARLTVTFFTPSTRFTATGTISTSENDAEESAAGVMNLTSTDLELVADGALGNQTVGLRFTPVAIPRNAFISTATVQFAADETQSGVTSLTIQAQAADNAPGFTTASNDLGNRPRTAAASAWSPPPWTVVGDRGSAQMTPNISAVVQEVVSRPGWTSGNALVLLIAGTGHRTAYSFDDTAAQPAELSVRYFNEVPQFTYGRWAVDFADLSGDPAADDDGDSVPNLVEYALGRHPLQPAAPPLFQLVPDAGGTLGFTWNCASNALDVRCDPEWADLPAGPWSTSGTMTRIIADDGMQRTLHTLIPGGSVRRFVRLRVRLP